MKNFSAAKNNKSLIKALSKLSFYENRDRAKLAIKSLKMPNMISLWAGYGPEIQIWVSNTRFTQVISGFPVR
jgi:hypothetical protein